ADPQRLYLPPIMDAIYGYEAVNVEAQGRDASSLLNWTRRMLAVRRSSRAFGRGRLSLLAPGNRKILAYLREYDVEDEHETILCVANLSRSAQPVELNLARFRGRVPVEMAGRTSFPPIGELPYLLTLPAHGFYWFRLASDADVPSWHEEPLVRDELPLLVLFDGWMSLFRERAVPWRIRMAEKTRQQFEREVLPRHVEQQRWFADKGGTLERVALRDWTVLAVSGHQWLIALIETHAEHTRDAPPSDGACYFMPLVLAWGDAEEPQVRALRPAALARVRQQADVGILADAIADESFCQMLLAAIGRREQMALAEGTITFEPGASFLDIVGEQIETLTLQRGVGQSSNATAVLGERVFLKAYRRLREGVNPEFEVGRYLTDVAHFEHCVPVAGSIRYAGTNGSSFTLALVQKFVPHQGDGWTWTIDYLGRFLEERRVEPEQPDGEHGAFVDLVATLGLRVGELHRAFALRSGDPDFDPEPMDAAWLQAWRASLRQEAVTSLEWLAQRLDQLPEAGRARATALLAERARLLARIDAPLADPEGLLRTRHHGDLHLGQILLASNDFLIIDFEGEPSRTIEERRARHTPLRDVAGMLRSFDYARRTALARLPEGLDDIARAEPLAHHWLARTRKAFLAGYARAAVFPSMQAVRPLLSLLELEKALYELRYELRHRPAWVDIPLRGILDWIRGD
ncbi:MAG: putative maltokinase, partial [Burkholderiaceae bacterium]|nr:putative maltokinase [Burkholderiaceae bacterium]